MPISQYVDSFHLSKHSSIQQYSTSHTQSCNQYLWFTRGVSRSRPLALQSSSLRSLAFQNPETMVAQWFRDTMLASCVTDSSVSLTFVSSEWCLPRLGRGELADCSHSRSLEGLTTITLEHILPPLHHITHLIGRAGFAGSRPEVSHSGNVVHKT